MKSPPGYDPKAVQHYEEGRALHRDRRLGAAERAYRKAIKINRNFVEAYNNLGNVLVDRSRFKEAFHAYSKALEGIPDHPMLLNNLGNALQLQGENRKAIGWFEKAIAQDPSYADAHNNLGNALRELGRTEDAVGAYRAALKIDDGLAQVHANLGMLLIELDDPGNAVSNLEKAIEIDPGNADAYSGLGNAYYFQGSHDQAVDAYRKALELDPMHTEACLGLGNALQALDQWDEAIESFQHALELEPDHAAAYHYLSLARSFSNDDQVVATMNKLYRNPKIPTEQRIHLSFALGNVHADLANHDEAFACFHRGNQLIWDSFQYDVSAEVEYLEKLSSAFPSGVFEQVEATEPREVTPVFVIGLPRSGKTLTEKALASHPLVHPAGERNFLQETLTSVAAIDNPREIVDRILAMRGDQVSQLAGKYLDRLEAVAAGTRFIVDTLPVNFYYVGFIRLLFPNAKVIHCHRQPEDACWFIYRKYFRGRRHRYSFDLAALGAYYRGYSDLMSHWNSVLPGFIHQLPYERLVTDTSRELADLFAYTGLEWDGTCLDRYENKPLHDRDIGCWRYYREHLGVLLEAINLQS